MSVINQHVSRLANYQPFDTQFGHLYAEYVDTQKSDELTTRALAYVVSVVDLPETRMVVLTGDAGHGKTHLCGQLISNFTSQDLNIRAVLTELCVGRESVATLPSGRGLRVIKDLSELTPADAVAQLVECIEADSDVTVVCANEGRLRQVLAQASAAGLGSVNDIQRSLNAVLETGSTTDGGKVHVINLNHQSVAARSGTSLAQQVLKTWVEDGRKWSPCERCDNRTRCPIYENKTLLIDPKLGPSRRAGFEALLRVAEQTGHVITIRDLLVFMAHTITGGLKCDDVHRIAQQGTQDNWQFKYLFHQAAFGVLLKDADRSRLRVFRAAKLFDPGERAIRQVDDTIVDPGNDTQGRFTVPSLDSQTVAQSRNIRQDEAEATRSWYRYLRRLSYFDAGRDPGAAASVSFEERLGLRHYSDFNRLFSTIDDPLERRRLHQLILRGLEAIQGIRGQAAPGTFAILDPAFSSSRSGASVISLDLPHSKVLMLSQTSWWESQGYKPTIADAVDWVDRCVYVVLEGPNGKKTAVVLDCQEFEFVCRSSRGLASNEFFQAEIRRIMTQLSSATKDAPQQYPIRILVNGRPATLSIDGGGIIEAGLG